MTFDRTKYPPDWRSIGRRIRDRANDRCEQCGIPNGATRRGSRIVLTIHHIDADTTHNEMDNLIALCQACHLAEHRTGALSRRQQIAAGQQEFV